MVPTTRLTISIDTEKVYKLQAKLQLKLKRKVKIADVIRIAIDNLVNTIDTTLAD